MSLWDAKGFWDGKAPQLLRVFEGETLSVDSVAFSPDGTRALSGNSRGDMELWDVATGDLARRFKGYDAGITSLAFSLDGSRILSGTRDATTRIWNAVTGEELVRMMASPAGEWTTMTRDGFFSSSHRDTEMLAIVRGLGITTIGQVHQSLFNPDLVREALAGDTGGELAEAAKVIGLEQVLASGPAPSVAIVSPADGGQSTAELTTVTARIEDRGKGVGRIEWRVKGITAAAAAGPAGRGPVHTVSRQLALDPCDNAIEVIAYNGSNLLASLPARGSVRVTGPADKISRSCTSWPSA
jgi:WD domain, G-beta repeat